MKSVVIIHVIAALMYVAGVIWTIAETLLYFVKDEPFNHGCLWLLGSGIVIALVNLLSVIFRKL